MANEEAVRTLINDTAAKHNGDDKWYYELIAGLISTSNGGLSTLVYEKALELAGTDREARRHVWARIREALLKITVTVGQARVWPAEQALLPIIKLDDIPTEKGVREWGDDTEQAKNYMVRAFGPKSLALGPLLEGAAPEIGYLLGNRFLGSVMGEYRILSLVETESIMVVMLLCSNLQAWAEEHTIALIRVGGTLNMVKAAIQRAKDIGAAVGAPVADLPNVEEICAEAAKGDTEEVI